MKKLFTILLVMFSLTLVSCGHHHKGGQDGIDGVDGKSAYQVWIDLGNTGTEQDFIDSLKGDTGENGEDGTDGIQLAGDYLRDYVDNLNPGGSVEIVKRYVSHSTVDPTTDLGATLTAALANPNLFIYKISGAFYLVDASGFTTAMTSPSGAETYLATHQTSLDDNNVSYAGLDVYWDDNAGNYYLSQSVENRKDLESIGAKIESIEFENVKDRLEMDFGLSAERSYRIAKLVNGMDKIQNKRALTDREMNLATKEILGFDYQKGMKALENHIGGDSADFEELLDLAAERNGTTPEAVQEILGEYLLK